MDLKTFRLDCEALLSQVVYGHGYLHYGYWEHGAPETLSLEGLGKAQHAYFEKLAKLIPRGVTQILDVGSGTGSNARGLIDRGYRVDCVCPSAQLNVIAKEKLGGSSSIFECKFEDFDASGKYDLVLFSESFHYTNAEESLRKLDACGGKYVIIFDYFRRMDSKDGKRVSHREFLNLFGKPELSSFAIVWDEDVTEKIQPTFLIKDELSNKYLKPFLAASVRSMKESHPICSFFLSYFLRKISRYSSEKSTRGTKFKEENEYRLILLTRITK